MAFHADPPAHLTRTPAVRHGPGFAKGRETDVVRMTRPPTPWSSTARATLPALLGEVGGRFAWFQTAVIEEDNNDTKYEALVQTALGDYIAHTDGATVAQANERLRALRAWVTAYKTWRDV